MKLRNGDPWMPAKEYAHSLKALTVNLIVRDINVALGFQQHVLGMEVVYADPDFSVLRGYGAEWMLHADHTYQDHAFGKATIESARRGTGIELRLHGCDPDAAEAAARKNGYHVLVEALNKGHGLREAYLIDPDGYVWVPDVPVFTQQPAQ
jgi:catechol 2,3-dioxygenase-like lactoylglutathione lyase family enzyme